MPYQICQRCGQPWTPCRADHGFVTCPGCRILSSAADEALTRHEGYGYYQRRLMNPLNCLIEDALTGELVRRRGLNL